LGLIGILLPIFVLVVVSLAKGRAQWSSLASEVGDGTFLFPIFILLADTIRRLVVGIRHGAAKAIRIVQIIAVSGCTVSSLYCVTAAVLVQELKPTSQSAHAVAFITFGCLMAALILGATGVIVANRAA
jgi:hypothetical protein